MSEVYAGLDVSDKQTHNQRGRTIKGLRLEFRGQYT